MRIKEDRSLLMYILLSVVTCGIYEYYFVYKLAQDMNVMCSEDGEETAGLLKFILLSIVTCRIYSWFWYYKLGDRIYQNGPKYGLDFTENGTTIIMWLLFGAFLCVIGSFYGIYIIIKNTNAMAQAYNRNLGSSINY